MVPTIRAPRARTPRAETRDWSRFMGSTENFENEVTFHPVTVLIAGNGRIISKDGDAVRMGVEVNVVEGALDPADG